ncbi:MAG: flap endonuclease-1 [Candidatus Bathyarchaeia archaeon]
MLGFNLTPIVIKQQLTLNDLWGRVLGVDANNMLYQFLALIRMRDGKPFTDSTGHVTSHLIGLVFRTTRLLAEFDIRPVFVFDGRPPTLKASTLKERHLTRAKARREWEFAVSRGDYAAAWSKAVRMDSLTQEMTGDAKRALSLLGIPVVQAPQEGEAQAAHMARRGDVWAANSRDYDSVLFGAPRLIRYLTISGQEYLPSKGASRPLIPELIDLQKMLTALQITLEQLIDLAILVGTDFNAGVRGIGPKTALKLIQKHGALENLPTETKEKLPPDFQEIRTLFSHPEVTNEYDLHFSPIDEKELVQFLCGERGFAKDKVKVVVQRMRLFNSRESSKLSSWFSSS